MGQYNVGVQYFSGKGVEQDYTKAVEFFEKAANQGFAPAQVIHVIQTCFLETKGPATLEIFVKS